MSAPQKSSSTRPRRRLGPWRARFFLLAFSLVVSALVLAGAEGVCRIAGYGGYPGTFADVGTLDDGSALVMTQHAGPSSYFFASRSLAGSLDVTAFEMPKPADTVRIVVAGGSAAKGSPWSRHLAASSFLGEMLSDCWPDRRVEIVNIGTTAIASYPVLGMVTESLEYDPDLVVAYLGNNEFYGAYGVASLHGVGRSPAMIRLIRAVRSLGIAQVVDSLRPGYDTSDPRTLMEAMVGQNSIGPEDPARAAAARNLEAFVGDLIDRCKARGVPVIVCPPPCNERGLAPLGRWKDPQLLSADSERVSALVSDAAGLLAAGRPEEAVLTLDDAIALSPVNATAHYFRGVALDALGRVEDAAEAYQIAVDLDPMPWRPPTASVDSVRRAAEAHGAVLCDLPAIFRAESPGGAVGWELMADHVHPSLQGQALIARSVIASMAALPDPLRVAPEKMAGLAGWESYALELDASVYDEYAAAYAMRILGGIPFFAETNPAFFERFDKRCREIEGSSPPTIVAQLQAWQDPATHKNDRRPIDGMVAQALFGQGEYAAAESLFDAARRAVTPYGSWELQYTAFMLMCRGQLQGGLTETDRDVARSAIARGRFLIRNGWSGNGTAERYTGEMLAMLGDHEQAIETLLAGRLKQPEEGKVAIDGDLVNAYLALGRLDAAESVADAGLRAGGPFAPYYMRMAEQVRAARGGR